MFARKGMQKLFSGFNPGKKRSRDDLDSDTDSSSHSDRDTDYWFSDIDSRPNTPPYFDSDEKPELNLRPLPQATNYVPPTNPEDRQLYLSRLRIWCCQCLHLSNYPTGITGQQEDEDLSSHTWPCQWCRNNLPRTHFFCDDCALVQIVSFRLEPAVRYVWNRQAAQVRNHQLYRAGAIGQHGLQYYMVECCQSGCKGTFRVDLDGCEKRKNPEQDGHPIGIWTDFGDWLCPECGQRACKFCLKYLVGTQVICGGENSPGWMTSHPKEDKLPDQDLPALRAKQKLRRHRRRQAREALEASRKALEGAVAEASRVEKGKLKGKSGGSRSASGSRSARGSGPWDDGEVIELRPGDEWAPPVEIVQAGYPAAPPPVADSAPGPAPP